MAVIEPRRKSPNSKNSVKMAERCCSRLARDSGKGYLLILTYHYVRICDTKKETSPIPPFMSRTRRVERARRPDSQTGRQIDQRTIEVGADDPPGEPSVVVFIRENRISRRGYRAGR